MSPTPQQAIFALPERNRWFVHLNRAGSGEADLSAIRLALAQLRASCARSEVNLVVAFGPTLLADLVAGTASAASPAIPEDFRPYTTVESVDGSNRRAVATQDELLLWFNHAETGVVWKAQYDARKALAPHMDVACEAPSFVFGPSLDMTGFTDGIGNPHTEKLAQVALVPDDRPGAGGSHVLVQRWVHDLTGWNQMPVGDQEAIIGRRKYPVDSKLSEQAPHSHLRHVELRVDGNHGVSGSEERDEMLRCSAPYAFHDGTVGLYFLGFCASQAPLRERVDLMYGLGAAAGVRDGLTDFSKAVSGSYYFAPSKDALEQICVG